MSIVPKVSVIIPIYNVEKYLRECLDSVVNQTLKDIEIICVDDGSTDNSLKILEEYALKDTRFIVLRQKNRGAGVARNYGMSVASGKYLSFLDADDFFSLSLFKEVTSRAEETKAEIVIYRFEKYNQKTKEFISCDYAFHKEWWEEDVFNYNYNCDKIFNSFNPAAWNKLFLKEFITKNRLTFSETKRTNDLYFTNSALVCAERIALLDKVLVYYRIGMETNSQATNYVAPLDFYKALKELKDFLINRACLDSVKNSYENLVVSTTIYNMSNNDLFNRMCILKHFKEFGNEELKISNKSISEINNFIIYNESAYNFLEKLYRSKKDRNVLCLKKQSERGNVKVSVIIPVYNVEKYLRECLDSVINQTLKDIEIICVDDGSADGCLDILREYANRDSRIAIFTQENGGLSVARNTGVQNACGRYIYFLDSDDKLRIDACEKLYDLASQKNLDVLYFDAESFFDSVEVKESNIGYLNYYKRKNDYSAVTSGKELFVKMFDSNEYRTSACLCFINREFYETHLRKFIPGILHEDNFFALECILKARRVCHLAETLFYRRVRVGSIVTTCKTFAHAYGYFKCAVSVYELLDSVNLTELEMSAAFKIYSSMLNNSRLVYNNLTKSEQDVFNYLNPFEADLFSKFVRTNKVVLENNRNADLCMNIKRVIRCYKDHGLKITLLKIKENLFR